MELIGAKKKFSIFLGQNGCQEKLSQILMDRNGLQASLVTPLGPAEKFQIAGQKSWLICVAGRINRGPEFCAPPKVCPVASATFSPIWGLCLELRCGQSCQGSAGRGSDWCRAVCSCPVRQQTLCWGFVIHNGVETMKVDVAGCLVRAVSAVPGWTSETFCVNWSKMCGLQTA